MKESSMSKGRTCKGGDGTELRRYPTCKIWRPVAATLYVYSYFRLYGYTAVSVPCLMALSLAETS